MIDGVQIKKLKVIPDERGFLMQMLRNDEEIYGGFGQAYMTGVKRGVAKGWHYHLLQDDHFVCVLGKALVVLCDFRKDSPTYKEVQEFILTEPGQTGEQILLKIPKGVLHGFAAHDCEEARIVNIPTKEYNYKQPDELRYPWNSEEVPYTWPNDIKIGG